MGGYGEVVGIAAQIKSIQLQVIDKCDGFVKLDYALRIAIAKVEYSVIKQNGSGKSLAPTVADRERIFVPAGSSDKMNVL